LTATTFGFPSAVHCDPVEKKPLYHFLPKSTAFSIATVGCNLHCLNCQNWELSQCNPEDASAYQMSPEKVVKSAQESGAVSIAYTYSDPVVFYEYALETAKIARGKNLKNILVTAGYINKEPWRELLSFSDAANINLKGISDKFYRNVCGATIRPVLDSIIAAAESKIILELTNLLIPTLNDKEADIRKLVRWIKTNLGQEIPLHFIRFFPHYKMKNIPPTPPKLLEFAYDIAKEEGLSYVYIGNLYGEKGRDTLCPSCGKVLVSRSGMTTERVDILEGKCFCGKEIYGLWK